MMWHSMKTWAACSLFLGGGAAHACVAPIPFQYEFHNAATTSLSAPAADQPCAYTVAIDAAARSTGAGFLHYRGVTPLSSARFAFRLDTSALTGLNTPLQAVQLFAVTGAQTYYQQPLVLRVSLAGGSTNPTLRIAAGEGTGLGQYQFTPVDLTQTNNVLRFEITIGSGLGATVNYWINHAFSDPPDGGAIGLQNYAYGGIVGAELGLSSPSNAFLSAQSGRTVVFDQIESSVDVLFADDFSSGAQ